MELLVPELILLLLFEHLFYIFFEGVERNFLSTTQLALFVFVLRIIRCLGGRGIFLLGFTLFIQLLKLRLRLQMQLFLMNDL